MLTRMLLYAAIITISAVLGANVYTSVVDARNWGSSIPESLTTARHYFAVADPGTFFRVFSPMAQVLSIAALVLLWKTPARKWAAAATILAISADVLTFVYFYPRNDIMFRDTLDAAAATQAWSGWSAMNYPRSALVLFAAVCELAALRSFEDFSRRRREK